MKVTICFDDVKVIVPCGNGVGKRTPAQGEENSGSQLRVSDVIENAISRFKKATGKVSTRILLVNSRSLSNSEWI